MPHLLYMNQHNYETEDDWLGRSKHLSHQETASSTRTSSARTRTGTTRSHPSCAKEDSLFDNNCS